LGPLLVLIDQQPAWSDLPIVLLTHHGGPEQNPASRFGPQLGNVTFLERPFHPETLISLVTTALRGRRRQYEARDRLVDLSQSELRLQNTLETLEQQVEERTAQLRHNEEVLRQSQKMEAVGQLTGGIAHDFNNMLTGIIGSLELLRRRLARGRTEDLDSLIDLGVTSANRAAGLTHRLLAFSRRQSLDSKPVEMNTLVVSMGELLQRSIDESIASGHAVERTTVGGRGRPQSTGKRPAQPGHQCPGCHARWRQTGGETSNRTSWQRLHRPAQQPHPGRLRELSVTDNGCGMPQSTINRAFDPFFTTKPIGQGTGLGLSMIYGFSKQSRGHVAIQSEVGKGTTVSLLSAALWRRPAA
jgi:signal transduction histidine kinase